MLELFEKYIPLGYSTRDIGAGVLGAVLVACISSKTLDSVRKRQTRKKIEAKRKIVQERKDGLRQRLMGEGELITADRKHILALDTEELLKALLHNNLDPIQVLEAYQAKALSVDEKINVVCDFILEATSWAEELQNVPNEQRGSLYGLPVSVKECFFVKGYDATIGLSGLINKPALEDSPFIKFIKDAHGIPFCLTNIPQTMVSYSCSNPVYGNTCNPHDLLRTPGGSSGGEGALIAAGASLLGIGSDIGGSLRIPSHFSGVVGLKPTNGRIYQGGRRGGPGSGNPAMRPCILSVAGFMSATVSGIQIGMKCLLENARRMSIEDWMVIPLQWQESLYTPGRKLRIGWYDYDGFFPATPGCKRAVREVVEKLEEAGHHVQEWKNRDHSEIANVFNEIMLSDGGYHSLAAWKGEILDQSIELNVLRFKTPLFLHSLVAFLSGLVSQKLKLLWDAGPVKTKDLWLVNGSKDRLITEFVSDWNNHDFDIVICPGFPFPAPPPQYPPRLLSACSYTGIYNILGHPVGLVPVTRENTEDQLNLEEYPIKEDLMYRLAYNATKGATGCPLGVQVIGRHYQEELVIHGMEIIEDLMKYDRSCEL